MSPGRRGSRAPRPGRGLASAAGMLLGAGAGVLAWSLIEAHWYTLRRVEVPVLPAGSHPMRVLHISDLHLVPGQRRRTRWVRDLARLEPDLVINTGDNMAHRRALPSALRALSPLLAYPGAFVMGSNDYYAPVPKNPARYLRPRVPTVPTSNAKLPGPELAAALRSHGWLDLNNRRGRLRAGGHTVELVGVDDPHLDRDELPAADPATRPGEPAPSSPASQGEHASQGARAPEALPVRLGVTHAPYQRVLAAMRSDGADLVLAGHTHGGQLCVPGYGALVTNSDLDTSRAKGLHGWPGERPDAGGSDSIWLHVSAGLGTSPYTPVRFACRPEATLLTLTARR